MQAPIVGSDPISIHLWSEKEENHHDIVIFATIIIISHFGVENFEKSSKDS